MQGKLVNHEKASVFINDIVSPEAAQVCTLCTSASLYRMYKTQTIHSGDKKTTDKIKTQPPFRQFVTKNVDVKRLNGKKVHIFMAYFRQFVAVASSAPDHDSVYTSTFSSPTNSCGNSSTLIVFHLPPASLPTKYCSSLTINVYM